MCWTDFVKFNFDKLVVSYEDATKARSEAAPSLPKTENDGFSLKSSVTIKVCSESFKSLLRNDLPKGIRAAFVDQMSNRSLSRS
jgi:hypothetical protein